jgi:hypothetical protein
MAHLYDHIDTELLKTMPKLDERKYWAFGKIYVASVQIEPFVLIDTDLFIEEPLAIRGKLAFQGYHFETFNEEYAGNPYLDFDNSLPVKWIGRWSKRIMPINTALLYMKDLSFVKKWYECALEIAERPDQIEVNADVYSYYMTLVEQRLLTMLAVENELDFDTFVTPVYLSHEDGMSGREWSPQLHELSESDLAKFCSIRHIWGLKSLIVENPQIRREIYSIIKTAYNNYEAENLLALLNPWKI